MNETFFNELSLKNKTNDISVSEHLKESYFYLKENGFTVCRARHQDITDLLLYISSISGVSPRVATDFILSFFKSPFEENVTEDEVDEYLSKTLYYKGEAVDGLHWAQLYDTISLSLLTEDEWQSEIVKLTDTEGREYLVRNVSSSENAPKHSEWIESIKEIVLIPSVLSPNEKSCSLGGDHGKDKLKEFWNRLKNCEYVEKCINSLQFNSFEKKLIRQVFPDGRIEIVLHWEDAGYGMVVQTTGRSYRETLRIAELICEKYDR